MPQILCPSLAVAMALSIVQCRYDVVLSGPTDPAQIGTAGRSALSGVTAGTGVAAFGSGTALSTAVGSGGNGLSATAGSGGGNATVATGSSGAAGRSAGSTVSAGTGSTASNDRTSAGAPSGATFAPGTSWQWQLTGKLDTSVSAVIFVVDLSEPAIASLTQAERSIVCNFSAGTRESFRSDVAALPAEVIGSSVAGQSEETWLDIRSASVRALMTKRLDLAAARGCHAVLPDSVDGYSASTGFSLTKADSADYLSFLSREAHGRGLGIGLSNAAELAASVEPWFDFVVEVNCLQYDECARYAAFSSAGKLVLHAELVHDTSSGAEELAAICSDPRRKGFSSIVKTTQLDAWRMGCE